jgi:hypothetical protein
VAPAVSRAAAVIMAAFAAAYGGGANLIDFADVFVVKYDASVSGRQVALGVHEDRSVATFQVALNGGAESFVGGGTYVPFAVTRLLDLVTTGHQILSPDSTA